MTFLSYARNFEDVVLWRALQGVERGVYVDVGAQDPVFDSVTKAFYERGWRGINIEPVDEWFRRLVEDRPKDVNLKIAVSDHAGTITLHEVVGAGMSTMDAEFASRHANAAFEIRRVDVPTMTLNDVFKDHAVDEVHFLKIDAEGAEGSVLAGLDLNRYRPWVILLEATELNATVPTHGASETLLTSRGYIFVHFDRLNCFYLPREREEQLRAALTMPPNYFDRFMRYPDFLVQQRCRSAEEECPRWKAQSKELLQQRDAQEQAREAAEERARQLAKELLQQRDAQERAHEADEGRARQLAERSDRLECRVEQFESELLALESRLADTQRQVGAIRAEADRASEALRGGRVEAARMGETMVRLHARITAVDAELDVYESWSWRLTEPLRWHSTE